MSDKKVYQLTETSSPVVANYMIIDVGTNGDTELRKVSLDNILAQKEVVVYTEAVHTGLADLLNDSDFNIGDYCYVTDDGDGYGVLYRYAYQDALADYGWLQIEKFIDIDYTSVADNYIIYYDLAAKTFKFKAENAGDGTSDHLNLSNIGIYSHAELDAWIQKGSDLTVGEELSVRILGKERNFSVNGSGTNHLNGLVFQDTEAAGWIVKLKFNDVITIGNGVGIQGGSSFALSCGTDFVTTQNDVIVFWFDGTFWRDINYLCKIYKNTNDIDANTEDITELTAVVNNLGGVNPMETVSTPSDGILVLTSTVNNFELVSNSGDEFEFISVAPSDGGDDFINGKIIYLHPETSYDITNGVPTVGDNKGIVLKKGDDYESSGTDEVLALMLIGDYWYEINSLSTKPATTLHTDISSEIAGLTEKETIVDADPFILENSESTYSKIKIFFSTIKSTLETYFNTKYTNIVGSSGYAGNVYLSAEASTIEVTYDQVTYDLDAAETEPTITVSSGGTTTNNYLFEEAAGTTLIPAGVWRATFYGKINSDVGDTYAVFTIFKRNLAGDEVDLFSMMPDDVMSGDTYSRIVVESSQLNFIILATDRLGVRCSATATSGVDKTVTYIVGDGRGAYFNTPLAIRHSQLREKNEEDAFQHITLANYNLLTSANGAVVDAGTAHAHTYADLLSKPTLLTSPLTTKGDIWIYDTDEARLSVGTNTQILTVDSTQPKGIKWATPTFEKSGDTLIFKDSGGDVLFSITGTSFGRTTVFEVGDVEDEGNGTTLKVDDINQIVTSSRNITAPSIIVSDETASTIASFDASKNVKSLPTETYPSLAELAYVKGVTSAIQTQINTKAPIASPTFTGTAKLLGTTPNVTLESTETYDNIPSAEIISVFEYTNGSTTTFGKIIFAKDNAVDGETGGYTTFSKKLDGAALSEFMRITSDGRLGILKTNPAEVVDINGSAKATLFYAPFAALTFASALTWDCSTGLNKTLTSTGDFTLTLSNKLNGMHGDCRINVTSATTITLPTSKLAGSVTSLAIGVYHLCWSYDGTNLEFNIEEYA